MLFSSIFLYASFAVFSALAAPIPRHIRVRATEPAGWPQSTNDKEKTSLGLLGGTFDKADLQEIDNAPALVATYPDGSYAGAKKPKPGIGGFIFQADFGADLSSGEAVLTYRVKFPEGFDFVQGGKLPGMCTSYPPLLCCTY